MNAGHAVGLVILMVFGSAHAAKPRQAECELDGSQSQMNGCAAERLQVADAQMNQLYKQKLQSLNPKNQDLLRQSQRAWITYRDKACLYEAGPRGAESGSIWPMQDMLCRVDLTRQRNEKLKQYVQCTEGGCPI